MKPEERLEKINAYGGAYLRLVDTLAQFPLEMLHYKPDPDSFSVHEIVVHIADSEANSYVRCRRCLAEPGLPVMAYDESRWAEALHYSEQNMEEALELFKWLRHASYMLITAAPEEAWANTIQHPENGEMTLDDWLDVYARHVPEHIEQMWQNYAAWINEG